MTGLVFKFLHTVYKKHNVEQKKIKLRSEWHSVENKTEIIQHVIKIQLSFHVVPIYEMSY